MTRAVNVSGYRTDKLPVTAGKMSVDSRDQCHA
jgi:hypothetical protein